ncbi:carboxylesterase 5A-like [Ornithodoros turicata]
MLRFSLLVCAALSAAVAHRHAVPTSAGVLAGKRLKVPGLGYVKQYLGVSYAQAPVGHLRFAPPVPLEQEAADQFQDATKFGSSCYQPAHLKNFISDLLDTDAAGEMSEDCLNLNVYVPETKEEQLPVVVWIPGEGFNYAEASQFDGSFLALQGNVIVVTVNYRVSAFGFLSTLTPHAPGNVGLLDQRMALRWVKQNIARFGGNPQKVTVMGRFSGSMSISIHLTTPLKEKLFERAVMQSGVAVGKYVFDTEPLNATNSLARELNCERQSISDMISCLQEVSAADLLKATYSVPKFFRPVFDGDLVVEEPLDVVKKGKHHGVDVIIGTNQDEGSICMLTLFYLKSHFYNRFITNTLSSEDFDEMISWNVEDFTKKEDSVVAKVTSHEYRYTHPAEGLRAKYLQFCSDIYISAPMERMARLLASNKKGSVYVYKFTHRPSFSKQPKFIQAAHGDDVLFSLGLVLKLQDAPKEEVILTKKMVASIANFALDSDPSVVDANDFDLDWPEFSDSDRLVMYFSTTSPRARNTNMDRAVSFWYDVVPLVEAHKFTTAVYQTVLTGRPVALTSSMSLVDVDQHRRPLHNSVSQQDAAEASRMTAAYAIAAMGICNVILMIVAAVSVTKLRRTLSTYQPVRESS